MALLRALSKRAPSPAAGEGSLVEAESPRNRLRQLSQVTAAVRDLASCCRGHAVFDSRRHEAHHRIARDAILLLYIVAEMRELEAVRDNKQGAG